MAKHVSREAEIILGFQPHCALDEERDAEMLHVFLNAVAHRYHDLRERNILTERAVHWLADAVDEATDCLNQEVNSKHVEDFDASQVPDSWWRALARAVLPLRRSDGSSSRPCSLEALVVEFRCLQRFVSARSLWVRLMLRGSALGHAETRDQVESLWAFVTAHEEVARCPEAERPAAFADLVDGVAGEAKQALLALAAAEPAAFARAKHALALKLLLDGRLATLRDAIEAGQVRAAEGEPLLRELRQRLMRVDSFRPRRLAAASPRCSCLRRQPSKLLS